ncbi:MAG: hypothetical protein ACREC5_03090 [Thermoplasmata archaeon]
MDEAPGAAERATRRVRLLGQASLALLVAQNLLGIGLNLYISLPTPPTFVEVFVSVPLLTAHIAVAFALFGLAVVLVREARRTGVPRATALSALMLAFLTLAIQEGFAFTFTADNAFSLGMEVGFAGAFASVALLLYRVGVGPIRAGEPRAGSEALPLP